MRHHSFSLSLCAMIITICIILLLTLMIWPSLLSNGNGSGISGVTASSHRSDSRQSLPNDHYLTDMDGDGVDEFVITSGSSIFVTRTNFHTEGRAYTRANATIKRAFTGDFIGAGKSQACLILVTHMIACYIMDPPPSSLSSDDDTLVGERLRLVLTNDGSMIDGTDDITVGDFDGDARDEVLLFTPSSGIFRVLKVSNNQFVLQTKQQFDMEEVHPVTRAQAIIGTATNLQIRIGNFDDTRVTLTPSATSSPSVTNSDTHEGATSSSSSPSPSPSAFLHQMAAHSQHITRQLLATSSSIALTSPRAKDDESWSSRLLSYMISPFSGTNDNNDNDTTKSSLSSYTPRTDDLLIYDPYTGIVRIYNTRVSSSASQPTVFRLSVMTQTNFLAQDDLVHIANIRGTVFDDIVVQSSNGRLHFFQGRTAVMTRGLVPLGVSVGPIADWLNPNDSSDIPVSSAASSSSTTAAATNGAMSDNDGIAADSHSQVIPSLIPIGPSNTSTTDTAASSMEGVSASSSSSDAAPSTVPRLLFARLKQLSQPVVRPDPTTIHKDDIDDDLLDAFDKSSGYGTTAAAAPQSSQRRHNGITAGISADDLHALEGHPLAGSLGVSPLWSPYAAAAGNSPFHVSVTSGSNDAGECGSNNDNNIDYDRLCPNDHRSDAMVWRYGNGQPVWSVAVAAIRNQQRTFEWVYTQLVVSLDSDQDGDGILTRHELGGNDQNEDGITDEPLHLYGASPFLQDVFVHVDYMMNDKKSMIPTDRAREMAVATMASVGINLHVIIGRAVPFVENLGGVGQFNWENDFDPIKKKYFPLSRQGLFHYCLFANKHNGGTVSGRSRSIPGADFLITLGGWDKGIGTYEQQGGTLLHELGHNLNLRHGGSDNANYKPNHISIMNYLYQVSGIVKDGKRQFLYSQLACESLNELTLNERKGIQCRPGNGQRTTTGMVSHEIAAAATAAHSGGTALPTDVIAEMNIDQWRALIRTHNNWYDLDTPIDFNGNGIIEDSIVFDLNGDDADQLLLGAPDEYSILRFDALGPLAVIPSINDGVDVKVTDTTTATSTSTTNNEPSSFVTHSIHEKISHTITTSSNTDTDNNSNDSSNDESDDPNDNEMVDEELSYTAYKRFRHIGSDGNHHYNHNNRDNTTSSSTSTNIVSSASSSLFQPLPTPVAMLRTRYLRTSSRVPIAVRLPSSSYRHRI